MNRRFAGSLILLSLCLSAAVGGEAEKTAKNKANEAGQATVKGEFDKLVDLTYPKVTELAGGREKMISTMETGLKEMKAKGFEFHSAKVGDASPVVAGGSEVFTIVPMTLEMKAPGGKIIAESFLIGVSPDKGKTWTFVDGSAFGNDEKIAKKLLPNLPAALKLPEKQKPIFKSDK